MVALAAQASATLVAMRTRSWNGAAFAGVRFQTVTACPALVKARTSAEPIRPNPMTVTVRCSALISTPFMCEEEQ